MRASTLGRCSKLLLVLTAVTLLASIAAASSNPVDPDFPIALEPSQVTTTLNGCRNDGGITFPAGGPFICLDAAYTGGELGKKWAELDLVPFRLITTNGQNGSTDYDLIIAADNINPGPVNYPGYDIMSVPKVNAQESSGSCSVTAIDSKYQTGLNGVYLTIYRTLTIHQDQGTTCTFDWYQRLALGSHNFPGAALHTYMYDKNNFTGGNSDVAITNNASSGPAANPQVLSKTMAAVQNTDHIWTVSKSPSPATLSFPNTCDLTQPTSQGLQVTVTWTKDAGDPLNITVTTVVTEKNPASSPITINLYDTIYSGTTALDNDPATGTVAVTIPANTTQVVLKHVFTVPNGTTDLNDIATATYTDADGNPVPGDATATASATVQSGGTNLDNSATISDSESNTGTDLTFSADSFTGASGAFAGYTAGTQTTGPVVWNSVSQSDSGSVTFNKTVYVTAPVSTSGDLTDTATLTGSDGFTTKGAADVTLSASASVALTINKTIDHAVASDQTFTFVVKDPKNNTIATPSVTVPAGQTTGSGTVPNLTSGVTYTVSENSASGWVTDTSTPSATITLPNCGGSVNFTNHQSGHIIVVKQTKPTGANQSFTFTPSYNNGTTFNLSDGQTNDSGDLLPGGYSVNESVPSGWTQTSATCDNGNGPGAITLAAGATVTCTFVNSQEGNIIVKKVTQPTGSSQSFTFTPAGYNGGNTFHLTDGTSKDSGQIPAGSYSVSEGPTTGWVLTSAICDNGNDPSAITLAAGGTVTCTFTNSRKPTLTVTKVVNNTHGGTKQPSDFPLFVNSGSVTSGVKNTEDPGTYTATETQQTGYHFDGFSGDCDTSGNVTLAYGDDKTCTLTNSDIAPKLHLRKLVVNDNGGTAAATDWTLTANGGTAGTLSGTTPVDSGAGFKAGTYALSESGPSGYTPSAWVCVGGTQSGSNIAVDIGGEATCTITNNDNPPALHLRKLVVNDNGGTALATAWTLTANGGTAGSLSGTTPVDSGTSFKAGTYALSESGPSGYAASAWVCAGGTQSGSNITVGLGQSATCTITNNDIAPKLHLRKVLNNTHGGTATLASFTLTATGTGSNNLSGTSPVDSGAGLKSDTWALSETNVSGYSASAWVCVGGTQSGSNITVGIGGEATCTITNNDVGGTIIIKKITKPVNTGSFGFSVGGTGYTPFTLNLQDSYQNTQSGLKAGTYTATEGTQLGWILTGIGADPADPNNPYNCTVTGSSTGVGDLNTLTATISLKNGDTVTCVFENTGNGATRTQGFWATHPQLANIAWFGGTQFGHTFPGVTGTAGIGNTTLCGRSLDLSDLMGGFWSSVSTTSTGVKRSALDQARMQLLQQLLAAELNASAFGSVPSGGSGVFATWESAYCGTDQTKIKNALNGAASFNTNGDSSTFTPGTAADSKTARAEANYKFWDVLP